MDASGPHLAYPTTFPVLAVPTGIRLIRFIRLDPKK
jgi:hypothetical protein